MLRGEKPEHDWGLRLDLDKRVFIDHLPDEQDDNILQKAAPIIADLLGSEMHLAYSGLHLSGHQNLSKVALSYHNKA